MYLISHHAGYGRNFCINTDDGTVSIHTKDEDLHVKVRAGIVVEQTRRSEDGCTTLRYGQGCKTTKADKKVREEYFQPGTLQAIRKGGLWKRETGIPLCGSEGTVECFSTSSGAYGKEVFKYSNGTLGYIASRWRKKLKVRRPNGKPWMVIDGQVSLSRYPIAEKLDPFDSDLSLWSLMRGQNWNITVYESNGTRIVTQGSVKNHQKQGKWLEKGKVSYYILGVKVSRELYEDNPDKWDSYEVLKIPNAQVRCSLLNRMGYDKLLDKVKHRVVDEGDSGQQLLQVDADVSENSSSGSERIMKLLKVICPSTGQVYVLRVPPDLERCEQARQWTFGLRQESIRQGAQLELVNET